MLTQLLELFAPYGLEDILNFQVRPTPHFLENQDRMKLYQKRLSKKNWREKWKISHLKILKETLR